MSKAPIVEWQMQSIAADEQRIVGAEISSLAKSDGVHRKVQADCVDLVFAQLNQVIQPTATPAADFEKAAGGRLSARPQEIVQLGIHLQLKSLGILAGRRRKAVIVGARFCPSHSVEQIVKLALALPAGDPAGLAPKQQSGQPGDQSHLGPDTPYSQPLWPV
jgi:hypothetical protein